MNIYVYLLSLIVSNYLTALRTYFKGFYKITNNQVRNPAMDRLCTHYQLSIISFVQHIKNSPISLWVMQLFSTANQINCRHTCY